MGVVWGWSTTLRQTEALGILAKRLCWWNSWPMIIAAIFLCYEVEYHSTNSHVCLGSKGSWGCLGRRIGCANWMDWYRRNARGCEVFRKYRARPRISWLQHAFKEASFTYTESEDLIECVSRLDSCTSVMKSKIAIRANSRPDFRFSSKYLMCVPLGDRIRRLSHPLKTIRLNPQHPNEIIMLLIGIYLLLGRVTGAHGNDGCVWELDDFRNFWLRSSTFDSLRKPLSSIAGNSRPRYEWANMIWHHHCSCKLHLYPSTISKIKVDFCSASARHQVIIQTGSSQ